MAITLKPNRVKLRTDDGTYTSPIVIGDSTTAEQIAELNEAIDAKGTAVLEQATQALNEIETKGQQTLDSIPDDYQELSGEVTELKSETNNALLTADIKQALLACFANVAWINENGQDYYDALNVALNPPASLTSIDAVYTQTGTVYNTDTLDSLKANLVVTAYYDDETSEAVTDYTLSGTLTVGTSTITVTYIGKTATFNVAVSEKGLPAGYTRHDFIKSSGDGYIALGFPANSSVNTDIYNYTIEIECEYTTTTSRDQAVFGGRPSDSLSDKANVIMYKASGGTAVGVQYCNYDTGWINISSGKHTIKLHSGKVYHDDVLVATAPSNVALATTEWHLFDRNNPSSQTANRPFSGRIYKFVMLDANGDELMNLVPCTDPNDVAGMFDIVGMNFLAPTATMTAGDLE